VGRTLLSAAFEVDSWFGILQLLALTQAANGARSDDKIKAKGGGQECPPNMLQLSDPHRHDDVTVLVVLAVGGAELAGGLGILELQLYVAGAYSLEEID
jgi:hypothetical protein